MKAFIITLKDNPYSETKAQECIRSSQKFSHCDPLEIEVFYGVDKTHSRHVMEKEYGLKWTWAESNTRYTRCPITHLLQHPYKGANLDSKIGCSLSHLKLWERCVELNEPILILEHDAIFIKRFPILDLHKLKLCQINDPDGSGTPKGNWWSSQMKDRNILGIQEKTWVRNERERLDIPDGLAGNSAYVITPFAAKDLITTVKKVGIWPNDAIMCKQLFPYLQEYYPFITKVNQQISTSSL